jgi:hypothetical protein
MLPGWIGQSRNSERGHVRWFDRRTGEATRKDIERPYLRRRMRSTSIRQPQTREAAGQRSRSSLPQGCGTNPAASPPVRVLPSCSGSRRQRAPWYGYARTVLFASEGPLFWNSLPDRVIHPLTNWLIENSASEKAGALPVCSCALRTSRALQRQSRALRQQLVADCRGAPQDFDCYLQFVGTGFAEYGVWWSSHEWKGIWHNSDNLPDNRSLLSYLCAVPCIAPPRRRLSLLRLVRESGAAE